jgi:hypothetical protein
MKKKTYKKIIRSLKGRIEVLKELRAAESAVILSLIDKLEEKKKK